ncbi:MAG: tryptophan synthase alpha chain [Solirubrobacteraceae bacterium]|nr:tryptophan synthase alpha chain [Solirubrobacteraceae bacterium]
MAAFFDLPRPDRPGLAVFLNAGDPPLETLREVILLLDECRVDCLELAVPFPNSASDGPVIRRSADRALADGVEREGVLEFVKSVRPELSHLRIALLADWSHSIKGLQLGDFIERVKASGADGLLVHGLPPRLRQQYYAAAKAAGQPIVTTCYASSDPAILDEAAEHGTAYIYLVAHYGRSGTSVSPDHSALVPAMERLRARTDVPIAVGFGVKNRAHIEGLGKVGADAAIVGSACVACVEDSLSTGHDVVADFRLLLEQLGETPASSDA